MNEIDAAIPNEVPNGFSISEACLDRIIACMETIRKDTYEGSSKCVILRQSATNSINQKVDVVITDPPYYDEIPYADLSDFFLCMAAPDHWTSVSN